jgi:hypothetical protein
LRRARGSGARVELFRDCACVAGLSDQQVGRRLHDRLLERRLLVAGSNDEEVGFGACLLVAAAADLDPFQTVEVGALAEDLKELLALIDRWIGVATYEAGEVVVGPLAGFVAA